MRANTADRPARTRRAATLVVGAVALAVTACAADGDDTPPVAGSSTPSAPAAPEKARRLSLAECGKPARSGRVDRSGYGLVYAEGSIQVAVRATSGTREQCVEYHRWGNPDVQVPPDTLLFTFSGGHGEGAQFEFLASALTGGKLPPIGPGGSPPIGPLNHPIAGKVGVSVDGTYYTSANCRISLTAVSEEGAAGRFDCPDALAQEANPFNPSDDVSYEETTPTAPPASAALSGRFDVQK